jgi:hypothetical protein
MIALMRAAQQAPVGLELGFARAAQADAALLALQVGPAAHQPRGHVLQLGQLDLQLALVGPRPLGEDIEDQPGAIEHPALQHALEVALLEGLRAWLKITSSAPCTASASRSSSPCRSPTKVRGSGRCRLPVSSVAGSAPAERTSSRNSPDPRAPVRRGNPHGPVPPFAGVGTFKKQSLSSLRFPAAERQDPGPAGARCARAPRWRWHACRPSG